MRRFVPIALFLLALVSFFLVARMESSHAAAPTAINEAINSVNAEMQKEQAGQNNNPAERAVFLQKQKQLLLNAKNKTANKTVASPQPKSSNPPSATLPPMTEAESAPPPEQNQAIASYMPIIITAVFGLLAIFVILASKYKDDPEARKWAFGVVGLIIGYWLKGS